MVAYPERGVGNDLEPLGVAFLQGPPFTLMISLTLTLSVQIPPLDGVQTLPSLPGPVSVRVKRNAFVAGSRLQTG